MWGRSSSFYLAKYLAEQDTHRFEEAATSQRDVGIGLGVFVRLLGVIALGFGIAAALASA